MLHRFSLSAKNTTNVLHFSTFCQTICTLLFTGHTKNTGVTVEQTLDGFVGPLTIIVSDL